LYVLNPVVDVDIAVTPPPPKLLPKLPLPINIKPPTAAFTILNFN